MYYTGGDRFFENIFTENKNAEDTIPTVKFAEQIKLQNIIFSET